MVDKIKIVERVIGPKYYAADICVESTDCIGIRNRRITCRQCVEICPTEAITVENRKIEVDEDKCNHCGACITVCPTQALSSSWLPWKDVLQKGILSAQATRGNPIIACSEVLSKLDESEDYDRNKVMELQCLERVDESLLLSLVASGASSEGPKLGCAGNSNDGISASKAARAIRLVTGDCLECEHGCMGAVWSLVADQVNSILGAIGVPTRVVHLDQLPGDAFDIEKVRLQNQSVSRRDMFEGFGDRAKHIAGEVADEVIQESDFSNIIATLGITSGESPLATASRQKVCEWALGAIVFERYGRPEEAGTADKDTAAAAIAAGALSRISDVSISSRVFGHVLIDGGKCVNCFLCVAYCHTHALEKLSDHGKVKGFLMHPNLCNLCGACVNMCKPDAIELTGQVDLAGILQEKPIAITYDQW